MERQVPETGVCIRPANTSLQIGCQLVRTIAHSTRIECIVTVSYHSGIATIRTREEPHSVIDEPHSKLWDEMQRRRRGEVTSKSMFENASRAKRCCITLRRSMLGIEDVERSMPNAVTIFRFGRGVRSSPRRHASCFGGALPRSRLATARGPHPIVPVLPVVGKP